MWDDILMKWESFPRREMKDFAYIGTHLHTQSGRMSGKGFCDVINKDRPSSKQHLGNLDMSLVQKIGVGIT
ncbi:hypothetical protein Ac2012v2_008108 [Leucoagaricus gongylophorus]